MGRVQLPGDRRRGTGLILLVCGLHDHQAGALRAESTTFVRGKNLQPSSDGSPLDPGEARDVLGTELPEVKRQHGMTLLCAIHGDVEGAAVGPAYEDDLTGQWSRDPGGLLGCEDNP